MQVIDLESGDVLHWLRLEGVVSELYDVVVRPGVVLPTGEQVALASCRKDSGKNIRGKNMCLELFKCRLIAITAE